MTSAIVAADAVSHVAAGAAAEGSGAANDPAESSTAVAEDADSSVPDGKFRQALATLCGATALDVTIPSPSGNNTAAGNNLPNDQVIIAPQAANAPGAAGGQIPSGQEPSAAVAHHVSSSTGYRWTENYAAYPDWAPPPPPFPWVRPNFNPPTGTNASRIEEIAPDDPQGVSSANDGPASAVFSEHESQSHFHPYTRGRRPPLSD